MYSLTLNPAQNQSLAAVDDLGSQPEGLHFRGSLIQTLRESFTSILVRVIRTWDATGSRVALFEFSKNLFLHSCNPCCILARAVPFEEVSSSQDDK
jgi:hypothetical protein